jgi:hypothetical protein
VQPTVSGLEQEFPGRVRGFNVDATTPEAMNACEELGFKSHGIVIRSSSGEVLWTQPDHEVDIDDVRSQLEGLLAGSS